MDLPDKPETVFEKEILVGKRRVKNVEDVSNNFVTDKDIEMEEELEDWENIVIKIDGDKVDFDEDSGKPYIDNSDRTMVPLRKVSEYLSYIIHWNHKTEEIKLLNNYNDVSLKVGRDIAFINNKEKPINVDKNGKNTGVKPILSNGRTYVPLRFIIEGLGSEINYQRLAGINYIYISTYTN